jgi:hypothetical protein
MAKGSCWVAANIFEVVAHAVYKKKLDICAGYGVVCTNIGLFTKGFRAAKFLLSTSKKEKEVYV